jgi:hypothetical protein
VFARYVDEVIKTARRYMAMGQPIRPDDNNGGGPDPVPHHRGADDTNEMPALSGCHACPKELHDDANDIIPGGANVDEVAAAPSATAGYRGPGGRTGADAASLSISCVGIEVRLERTARRAAGRVDGTV